MRKLKKYDKNLIKVGDIITSYDGIREILMLEENGQLLKITYAFMPKYKLVQDVLLTKSYATLENLSRDWVGLDKSL